MDVLKKLGGILPRFKSDEEREVELQEEVNKGAIVEKLRTGHDWPAVDSLLTDFHDRAVQEMSSKGITPNKMERLNHRLELIRNFREEVVRIIQDGNIALQRLGKLKEKQNV